MASAITELQRLKAQLESKLLGIQAEIETVSKAIKIIEREIPGASPQMSLPEISQGAHEEVKTGLSEMIRQIVGEQWISPVEVRDRLIERGYHNTDKGRLLSSVYATMKRLGNSKELDLRKRDGRTEFMKRSQAQAA